MIDQTMSPAAAAGDILDRIDRWVVAGSRRVAFAGVIGMLVVAFGTIGDVALRYLFNSPMAGFNEVVSLGLAIAIAATFPAGAAQRVNLTVDFLGRRLGPQALAWLRVLGAVALLLFYTLLSWRIAVYAGKLMDRHAVTLFLELPQGPVMAIVSAFLGVSALIQLLMVFVAVKFALAGFPDPSGWSLAQSDDADSKPTANAPLGRVVAVGVGVLIALALVVWGVLGSVDWLAGIARSHTIGFTLVMLFVLWIAMVLYVPLTAAMGLLGVLGTIVMITIDPALNVLGNEAVQFLVNAQVAVLPLFLMMGSFAVVAGLSSDIYALAHTLLAHFRGGLALATIGGCGGFGALTGSSLATVATIGRIALPEMGSRGYSVGLATGCVAAGGTLGALVPPSIPLIFYALLTEQSVGILFVAAVIPAMLALFMYMTTASIYVRVFPDAAPQRQARASFADVLAAVRRAWGALLLLILVVGGIYSGIYTETEAAAVGAACAFLFALFRGKINRRTFLQVMGETTATTAMIYLIIFGVLTFSFFIAVTGLPELMASLLDGVNMPPLAVIAIVLVVYILLGAVMDSHSVLFITIPIVVPLVISLGYDLIWWGVIMLMVLETGLITPPFGIHVFVLKGIAGQDVPLGTVFKGVAPFVISDLIKISLVVLFPALALWLPSTMVN